MRSKAWACAMVATMCAGAAWADDTERTKDITIIVDREELEELRRDSEDIHEDIAETIREALEEARKEMRDAHGEVRRHREGEFQFRTEDREEIRDALREAFRETGAVMHDVGEAMREFMAQGIPGLGGIAPLIGAEPFFGDSGAGNARPVDERKSAVGVQEIEIENVSGRITLEGWDQDEIRVSGSIGEEVEELIFEIDGDSAEVRVKIPKGLRNPKIRTELTIQVPKRLSVEARTVSGGVEARNVEGSYLDLETVSGGVQVTGCTGDIDASTTSGSVDIADARGVVRAECVSGGIEVTGSPTSVFAENVSGSIEIEGAQREVEAESVSGRISVLAGALESLRVESVSGGFDYEGGIAPNGRFEVSSISGGVRLTFTSDVAAEFDLESFSGGITIDLPGAPTSAKRQVSFKTGDGSARIDVEAFNGGIRVGR